MRHSEGRKRKAGSLCRLSIQTTRSFACQMRPLSFTGNKTGGGTRAGGTGGQIVGCRIVLFLFFYKKIIVQFVHVFRMEFGFGNGKEREVP